MTGLIRSRVTGLLTLTSLFSVRRVCMGRCTWLLMLGRRTLCWWVWIVGFWMSNANHNAYPHVTQRPFAVWNRHLALMRDWLRDTYGVNTYSLNPFVNLHLEGHKFGGL